MGNATPLKIYPAFLIGFLGLALIGTCFIGDANASVGCSAIAEKTAQGDYSGCKVTMGNRDFTIGAQQSSEEGCSQVCGIMAEVSEASAHPKKTARAGVSILE